MTVPNSQTEPKKKSKRFYIILAATVLLLALLVGVVIFELSNMTDTSNVEYTNYGPGPVEIEVTTDKSFHLQGELINFTYYINNPQDWPVPHPTGVSYIIREDDHVVSDNHVFSDYFPGPNNTLETNNTFPAHSRTPSLYHWKSGSVPPGTYTLTITYYGLVDYGEGGNYTFEIR